MSIRIGHCIRLSLTKIYIIITLMAKSKHPFCSDSRTLTTATFATNG